MGYVILELDQIPRGKEALELAIVSERQRIRRSRIVNLLAGAMVFVACMLLVFSFVRVQPASSSSSSLFSYYLPIIQVVP